MAADIAPGMNRSFLAEEWRHLVPRKCWYDAREEANDRVNLTVETDIQGYDIDRRGDPGSQGKRQAGWGRKADPFSAASGERTAPSQTLWIHNHQPSLWGTIGGKSRFGAALSGDRRKFQPSGQMVHVSDHLL